MSSFSPISSRPISALRRPAVVSGLVNKTLAADAGSYVFTGTAASILHKKLVTAGAGSYAFTGTAASVLHGWKPTAGAGSYSFTGTAASLLHKWKLPAEAAGAGPGVVSLLHFDGADTSTSFTDELGHTWTAANSAQIDNAQSKFGGTSALFTGSTSDHILGDGSSDFAFGASQSYTIDFWVRFASDSINQFVALYDSRNGSNGKFPHIYKHIDNTIRYWIDASNGISGTTTVVADTWYHIALTRSVGAEKLFINGVQEGTTRIDTSAYLIGANRPVWGIDGIALTDNPFWGWIDEARVVKGTALWTTDFTPPTAASLTFGYTFSGSAATIILGANKTLAAGAGSYAFTGTAASILHNWKLAAGAGSYLFTGTDATIRKGLSLAAGAGSYAFTGTAASILHAWKLIAGVGSYLFTGSAATITPSGVVVSTPPLQDYGAGAPSRKYLKKIRDEWLAAQRAQEALERKADNSTGRRRTALAAAAKAADEAILVAEEATRLAHENEAVRLTQLLRAALEATNLSETIKFANAAKAYAINIAEEMEEEEEAISILSML